MGKKFRIRPIKPKPEITLLLAHEIVHNTSEHVSKDNLEGLKPVMRLMAEAIDRGGFPGTHGEGYALAHHQVSIKPFAFFVLRGDIANSYFHGERVIINPKWQPHALDGKIEELREACLSHPFKGSRKVRRNTDIVVHFETIDGGAKTMVLQGIAAQVFQHEYDHITGKTIWDDKI